MRKIHSRLMLYTMSAFFLTNPLHALFKIHLLEKICNTQIDATFIENKIQECTEQIRELQNIVHNHISQKEEYKALHDLLDHGHLPTGARNKARNYFLKKLENVHIKDHDSGKKFSFQSVIQNPRLLQQNTPSATYVPRMMQIYIIGLCQDLQENILQKITPHEKNIQSTLTTLGSLLLMDHDTQKNYAHVYKKLIDDYNALRDIASRANVLLSKVFIFSLPHTFFAKIHGALPPFFFSPQRNQDQMFNLLYHKDVFSIPGGALSLLYDAYHAKDYEPTHDVFNQINAISPLTISAKTLQNVYHLNAPRGDSGGLSRSLFGHIFSTYFETPFHISSERLSTLEIDPQETISRFFQSSYTPKNDKAMRNALKNIMQKQYFFSHEGHESTLHEINVSPNGLLLPSPGVLSQYPLITQQRCTDMYKALGRFFWLSIAQARDMSSKADSLVYYALMHNPQDITLADALWHHMQHDPQRTHTVLQAIAHDITLCEDALHSGKHIAADEFDFAEDELYQTIQSIITDTSIEEPENNIIQAFIQAMKAYFIDQYMPILEHIHHGFFDNISIQNEDAEDFLQKTSRFYKGISTSQKTLTFSTKYHEIDAYFTQGIIIDESATHSIIHHAIKYLQPHNFVHYFDATCNLSSFLVYNVIPALENDPLVQEFKDALTAMITSSEEMARRLSIFFTGTPMPRSNITIHIKNNNDFKVNTCGLTVALGIQQLRDVIEQKQPEKNTHQALQHWIKNIVLRYEHAVELL